MSGQELRSVYHWASYKAGIWEVVKWVEEHSSLFIAGQDIATCAGNEIKGATSYYPIIKFQDWQAKLKEWGIAEGKEPS